jgi:hypothetical protein
MVSKGWGSIIDKDNTGNPYFKEIFGLFSVMVAID